MEYIFEFILDLVLEGSIEVSKSRNIPKYIRYPLIVIISLFFIGVIGLILLVGILSLKENILLGIFFILILELTPSYTGGHGKLIVLHRVTKKPTQT